MSEWWHKPASLTTATAASGLPPAPHITAAEHDEEVRLSESGEGSEDRDEDRYQDDDSASDREYLGEEQEYLSSAEEEQDPSTESLLMMDHYM